jgi:molybdopterin converting factor small subunit
MTVTVKLFAILRERAERSELRLELPLAATVAAAREALAEDISYLREYLPRVAWAVNRSYAPVETELHDGDELAAIPAVSGG